MTCGLGKVLAPGLLRARRPILGRQRKCGAAWAQLDQGHQQKHFDVDSLWSASQPVAATLGYSGSVFHGVGVPSGASASIRNGEWFARTPCGGIDLPACVARWAKGVD